MSSMLLVGHSSSSVDREHEDGEHQQLAGGADARTVPGCLPAQSVETSTVSTEKKSSLMTVVWEASLLRSTFELLRSPIRLTR